MLTLKTLTRPNKKISVLDKVILANMYKNLDLNKLGSGFKGGHAVDVKSLFYLKIYWPLILIVFEEP